MKITLPEYVRLIAPVTIISVLGRIRADTIGIDDSIEPWYKVLISICCVATISFCLQFIWSNLPPSGEHIDSYDTSLSYSLYIAFYVLVIVYKVTAGDIRVFGLYISIYIYK